MTRQEHVEWCKSRALELVEAGDVAGALASMTSDLSKHPETRGHSGVELGMMLMMGGHLSTPAAMRKFILGFN